MSDKNSLYQKLDMFLKNNAPIPPSQNKSRQEEPFFEDSVDQFNRRPRRQVRVVGVLAVAAVLVFVKFYVIGYLQDETTDRSTIILSEALLEQDSAIYLSADDSYANWDFLAEAVSTHVKN